jgi:large conductance mechanosensitive channel
MKGFKQFLLRGNLVELAVAFVVGVAFGALITAFVKDLITPLIAAIGGKPNFSQLYFTVNHSRFLYGDFINAVIAFLIIAAVVYFLMLLPLSKLLDRAQRNEEATEQECPECLSDVPIGARRCRYCTAELSPGPGTTAEAGAGVR